MRHRVLILFFLLCASAMIARADEIQVGTRHIRHYVRPTLPDIAKRMNLHGSVKLEIDIAPTGKVTAVRARGGHPVLVESASEAVRSWEFEPAKETTTGPVLIDFQ